MATSTRPIEHDIAKLNDEIEVGTDLKFQQKWWKFERILWLFIAAIVVAALAGVFGRGFLSKGQREASDGSMKVEYERIARYSTPSMLRVEFGPAAMREGHVQLWLSDAIVKSMGVQRVVPQPSSSSVTEGGILVTFPASSLPASVQLVLEPAKVGLHELTLKTPGSQELRVKVAVLP